MRLSVEECSTKGSQLLEVVLLLPSRKQHFSDHLKGQVHHPCHTLSTLLAPSTEIPDHLGVKAAELSVGVGSPLCWNVACFPREVSVHSTGQKFPTLCF